jgi:hypothetical protein
VAGLVQQRHTEDDHFDCVTDFCGGGGGGGLAKPCPRRSQIRVIEYTHQDSRGPHHARYFAQSRLLQDEEFCLQIDAHSDVVPHWDEELISAWHATDNEMAVLSTRPPDVSALKNGEYPLQQRVPHLCQATVDPTYVGALSMCL